MTHSPHSSMSSFPSGRYAKTNPLRRLFGLHLLSATLPEPLRTRLVRAWMQPRPFDGNQAIQSVSRQRPAEAHLPYIKPGRLGWITHIELEVSRRVVETPRTEITRELRNKLLRSQAAYLSALHTALAMQVGEPAAQAEFERLLLKVV